MPGRSISNTVLRLPEWFVTFLFIALYLVLPYLFFGFQIDWAHVALAPLDAGIQGFPLSIYSRQLNLWNPYVQLGTFPFKDIGTQALYPAALLIMRVFPNPLGYNLLLFLHYSIAGIFTFLFLKRLRIAAWAAFIGGLAFMFCGFLSAHKEHNMVVMTAVYLPVILFFIESYIALGKMRYLAGGGVAFGLALLADYIAMPVYIGMLASGYVLYRCLIHPDDRARPLLARFKRIGLCMAGIFGLGLLLAAAAALPILESLRYVTREQVSYEFFASYSFQFNLLPLLLIPYYWGTEATNGLYPVRYFGPWNLTEMSGYMGMLPILCAVMAFLLLRKARTQVWFWTIVAVVGFILVLGNSTPLYRLMYHVPVYNMFRVSARNWLEVNFAGAVLCSIFLDALSRKEQEPRGVYRAAGGAALGVCALFALCVSRPEYFAQTAEQARLLQENVRIASPVVAIPLALLVIACATLLALPKMSARPAGQVFVFAFIFIDLFSFGYFHNLTIDPYLFTSGGSDAKIRFLQSTGFDPALYRVYPLDYQANLYPNQNVLNSIQVINGYGPIWLKRYSRLTGFTATGISTQKEALIRDNRVLSALATRYILSAGPAEQRLLEGVRFQSAPGDGGVRRFGSGAQANEDGFVYGKRLALADGTALYENRNTLPRLRFVQRIVPVDTFEAVVKAFWSDPDFDPSTSALVEGIAVAESFQPGEVLRQEYADPVHLRFSVRTDGPAFLVLADAHYPGWRAWVDGVEQPLYLTNGVMRGIRIAGAGTHEIALRFIPLSFYIGLAISGLTLAGLCAAAIRGLMKLSAANGGIAAKN